MLLHRPRREPTRDLPHRLIAALLFAVALTGCSATTRTTAQATTASADCNDQYFEEVRDRGASGTEVTICGRVRRVRPPHVSRSGRHLPFDVVLPNGDDVWIDANLDVLGALPVRPGEHATVRGEYFYDGPRRDGIHWTHRTTHGPHPPGFVILDGVRYQ